MKLFKSHFWYNKRQRNGIFFLLLLIVAFQLVYFYVVPMKIAISSNEFSDENTLNIDGFLRQIDSLEVVIGENKKPKIYPFNPSFITDYKGYQLGMSNVEINRLLKHRQDGKYINSVAQFQSITKVSDSLLATISPYFKFPDWVIKEKTKNVISKKKLENDHEKTLVKQDLNTVKTEDLVKIYGIGQILAARIIKYRNSINGFITDEQLYEVYGLSTEVTINVLKKYTVKSKPDIIKLNVNTATFKDVLRLPYIDYELTKLIFNYRDEVAEIQSIEELKNIEGFPLDKFDRIVVYLEAK